MASVSFKKVFCNLHLTVCLISIMIQSGCTALIPGERHLSARQLEILEGSAQDSALFDLGFDSAIGIFRAPQFSQTHGDILISASKKRGRTHHLFHSIIEVKTGGKNYLALVDTGSPFTIISHKLAQSAGAVPLARTERSRTTGESTLQVTPIAGLGGQGSQIMAILPKMTIGDVELTDIPAGIVDQRRGLGGIESISSHQVDMLIGNDFLSRFSRVLFDFKHNRIEMSSSPSFLDDRLEGMTRIDLIADQNVPIVRGRIVDNPEMPIVIDTGAGIGLWLPHSLYESLDLLSFGNEYRERKGRAFGGETAYKNIPPHAIEIGNLVIRYVLISAELPNNLAFTPAYALLGQRVLQRYSLVIDYAEGCLYISSESPISSR